MRERVNEGDAVLLKGIARCAARACSDWPCAKRRQRCKRGATLRRFGDCSLRELALEDVNGL